MIPLCWPAESGACGCGGGHVDKAIGKAALVSYVDTPPTPERIVAWRKRWPRANVGLLLEWDHRLVIDCDSDAALGEATALGLPPAPVSMSGRGRHYHYRRPADAPATNVIHAGASRRIDVLAKGYVVAPPSMHRAGRPYEWIVDERVHPLAPAPAWAVALLRAAACPSPATNPIRESPRFDDLRPVDLAALAVPPRILRVIHDGGGSTYPSRSEAIYAVIMAMIGAGYDDATIAAVMVDASYGISEKPRQQGRRWLVAEIARARRKSDVESFA